MVAKPTENPRKMPPIKIPRTMARPPASFKLHGALGPGGPEITLVQRRHPAFLMYFMFIIKPPEVNGPNYLILVRH
jgi:hypothetical protein